MSFKKYDGSVWQSITPKQLKGIPYTGTLPATLTGTKAGYLHRYKIYGNTEQTGTPTPENPIVPQKCGERTENLFDKTATDTNNGYVNNKYLTRLGEYYNNNDYAVSEYIEVAGNTTYTFTSNFTATSPSICFYDAQKVFLSGYRLDGNSTITATSDNSAAYARISYRKDNINVTMFTKGSTAPTSYEPYGYKLPLLSGSTPADIYIGDDTLSTEEYVDSGTGKIYRMVSGVLTPTDPPVPFPQIPTSVNSTTISWAGEGLAPSQFDSVQEWVDIPTYTYTNGAWVADNSN